MRIREADLPVREAVHAACEFLGLDPLHIANEGKLVAVCPPEEAQALLTAMRAHPLGAEAADIGAVTSDERGFVEMETAFGGTRLVEWLHGEQLPRIC
jgi:hydrogenase expression/formation protein HypE